MRDKTKVLKSIVTLVISAHLLVFYLFHFNPFHTKPKKVLAKRILRENFRVIEKPQIATRAKAAAPTAKSVTKNAASVAKKTTPQPPKNTPKPTELKKETAVAKVATPVSNSKSQQKTIDKSLAKDLLDQWPQEMVQNAPASKIEIPKALAALEIESYQANSSSFSELSSPYSDTPYGDYLLDFIGNAFQIQKIKENGLVRLEFTLNNKGELLNIDVKSFTDVLSKEIVIETMKKLKYPPFFGELVDQQEYTFKSSIKAQ